MAHKKWVISEADKETASVLSEKFNIDPLVAFLLVSRGIDDDLAVSNFLTSTPVLASPFQLKDMDKAAARISRAVDSGEKICVYGDYDCDGVTSTALLYSVLESLGADVFYYIPDRFTEGYGLNKSAADDICRCGTGLIVTVDNGISSLEEAEYIYTLGMELVVTDHHQLAETLPRAEAVVNPQRSDNQPGFLDFAGVGVAFKLACALFDSDVQAMLEQYADLVALGTIGDVVPLRGENRCLVRAGTDLINTGSRIGIEALKAAAGKGDSPMSAVDIAFQLCPRINAAGRMEHAGKAVELLLCDDDEQAAFLAQQLSDDNSHRQELEKKILLDIRQKIAENPAFAGDRVIVIDGKNYHQGVIGIVASRISEEYGKPAIIIATDEDGYARGSARSIEGFNMFAAFSACEELFLHFGGHPLAAGMSLKETDIPAFRSKINQFAAENYYQMPVPCITLDCKLSPFYIDIDFIDHLAILEPYGAENPQAVFGLFGMTLASVSPMGEGKHIRIEAQKKGKSFRIVKFGTSADDFPYHRGDRLDFAVKVSKNYYNGRYYVSIQAADIRKSGVNDDKYFKEKADYEQFVLGRRNETELYPSRDICSVVYRFLRENRGWKYSFDDLYFQLADSVTYGQLKFVLKVFCEAGLITYSDQIVLKETTEKVRLEQTAVMTQLKGRLGIE